VPEFPVKKVSINGIFCWVPCDPVGNEYTQKAKINEWRKMKMTNPRIYKHLQKFFVMIREVVYPNLDHKWTELFPNEEVFRDELTMRAGYYHTHTNMNGEVMYWPYSISFEKMDQDKFNEYYSKVIDIILKYFMPGNTKDQLELETNLILGFS
jgi:hypothetical protein